MESHILHWSWRLGGQRKKHDGSLRIYSLSNGTFLLDLALWLVM